MYIVYTGGDKEKELLKGSVLSEIITTCILRQIKVLDDSVNTLTKIDKDYYKYFNQLSCIYNLAEDYAELFEIEWSYVENFLDIYNQARYLKEEDFIRIVHTEDEE
ncbi:hypothetical protein [Staphylococcus sp. Marseille-Q6910]|uniref:hypothetical protein n=1 Tax=Staphylococcus sp. Marseille-Q6910 TaxID=2937990 RepID=UPI00203EED16|nr:hypothetical protein [Staphylococcus sp. Marseille-Q6910]